MIFIDLLTDAHGNVIDSLLHAAESVGTAGNQDNSQLDHVGSLLQSADAPGAPAAPAVASSGFKTWLLGPVVLGCLVVVAVGFVGIRYSQFKARRANTRTPTKKVVKQAVSGFKHGDDHIGDSMFIKRIDPGAARKEALKLSCGEIPDYGHCFEEKTFQKHTKAKCRVCAVGLSGRSVQCANCLGPVHSQCLSSINFQCERLKDDSPRRQRAVTREDELPEDAEAFEVLFEALLKELHIPAERHASMKALPMEHKRTLVRQQMMKNRSGH